MGFFPATLCMLHLDEKGSGAQLGPALILQNQLVFPEAWIRCQTPLWRFVPCNNCIPVHYFLSANSISMCVFLGRIFKRCLIYLLKGQFGAPQIHKYCQITIWTFLPIRTSLHVDKTQNICVCVYIYLNQAKYLQVLEALLKRVSLCLNVFSK